MTVIMEIYTDGSLGTKRTAGLGWMMVTDAEPIPGFAHTTVGTRFTTSRYVELEAIKAAIKDALRTGHDLHHAVIYTDSLDAVRLITAERDGHGRGRPRNDDVPYRELTRWIALEMRINHLHIRHVRGHNGTPGNEAADRLALMARRNREYGLDRSHGRTMAETITAAYTSALTPRAGHHWGTPDNIRLHHAAGEPLCGACAHELQALEREAS